MKKRQFEIVDNYLPEEEFQKILNIVENTSFTWSLAPQLLGEGKDNPEDYYFTRVLIEKGKEIFPGSSQIVKILLDPVAAKLQKKLFVTRSKINLFLKEPKHFGYGMHQDVIDGNGDLSRNYNSLLIYLEDSNGYTEFDDGDIVNSVRNRAIFFRSDVWHQTVTSTDTLFRRNVNINYKILD
jgi:hypothetical protein